MIPHPFLRLNSRLKIRAKRGIHIGLQKPHLQNSKNESKDQRILNTNSNSNDNDKSRFKTNLAYLEKQWQQKIPQINIPVHRQTTVNPQCWHCTRAPSIDGKYTMLAQYDGGCKEIHWNNSPDRQINGEENFHLKSTMTKPALMPAVERTFLYWMN